MNRTVIPVNRPMTDNEMLRMLTKAFRSGWLSGNGPYVEMFENQWASVCGRKYGIAVCNGTAALETAVFACGLPKGSEIVLPSFTIISCLIAALRNGVKPVLVDADPVSWCMDPQQTLQAFGKKTSAVMPVHIYGHPADMGRIEGAAKKAGIKVIEDAAEAHGSRCRGRLCGSFGDASAFSFYANKLVTSGEGGMVLTDSRQIAERCRSYRNLYFGGRSRFMHEEFGYNFRMSNLLAALGLVQAGKWKRLLARKRKIASIYDEVLGGIPGIQLPATPVDGLNSYWVYGVVIEPARRITASVMGEKLMSKGIETRPFFTGLHRQPVCRRMGIGKGRYPVTDMLSRQGLYLPSGTGITDKEAYAAAETFAKCL